MEKLIIFDLCGTLIEANHVATPQRGYYKNEYMSRLMYCARKINQLLNKGIKIVILSGLNHTEAEDEEKVLSDIDMLLDNKNKNNITYIVSTEGLPQYRDNLPTLKTASGRLIEAVESKSIAYENLLKLYSNHYVIAVDDNPNSNSGFAQVYFHGGRICYINNFFNSRELGIKGFNLYKERRYPYADNETLIKNVYVHLIDPYFECTSKKEKIKAELYRKYLNGEINIKEFLLKTKLLNKKYFEEHGYCVSQEELEEAYDKGVITIGTSFEEIYQKVLRNL